MSSVLLSVLLALGLGVSAIPQDVNAAQPVHNEIVQYGAMDPGGH